jgi:hypothetical protein
MCLDVSQANKDKTGNKKNSRDQVKSGVQKRQLGISNHESPDDISTAPQSYILSTTKANSTSGK